MKQKAKAILTGDAILKQIDEYREQRNHEALAVCYKLADREPVTDGELLDALFTYAVQLDIADPLLPIAMEVFKRFMEKVNLDETPNGVKREWLNQR